MKNCRFCGKEFDPKSGKQVFCSDACKMKEARAKKKTFEEKSTKEAVDKINNDLAILGLSGTTTMYDSPKQPTVDDECTFKPPRPWIKTIETFCKEAGIIPEDLIPVYKTWMTRMGGVKEALENQSVTTTTTNSSGIIPQKGKYKGAEYNPNDNWRYNVKIGKKEKNS